MKKTLITTATALALLATPLMNKADAASLDNNDCNNIKVAHYQYKTNNGQDLQTYLNQVLSKYNVKMNISDLTKEQIEKATQQAKPTSPAKTTINNSKPATEKPVAQAKPTTPSKPVAQKPVQEAKPAKQSSSSNQQASNQLSAFEKEVVDLTNQERAKNGLPALAINTELSKMARVKSNDMATNKYFDHTSPTYGSPFDMMKQFGITYRAAGENIAMGQRTPQEVVNAWMNSPGHRANILNKDFNQIGVGYVANGNYWTQEFIGK